MSVVYKVTMSGVAVNMYTNPGERFGDEAAREQALTEYKRLNEKYPDRQIEVIRVTSDVIVKSR